MSHSNGHSTAQNSSKLSTASTKFFGITPPISTNEPTEQDLQLSQTMLATLESMGYTESKLEGKKRESVLGRLNLMVKQFVRRLGEERGLPDFILNECGGKIFTFGSYRLGVHQSGADIDTLCVVPQHVERIDFFTQFYQLLQECPEITELTQVPDAYVPVIKMVFCGIPIDLVFARMLLPTIPEDLDLLDHSYLRNLDEKCILSLNGSRTTDEILRLVPNVSTFHAALKCIKVWAKRRAVYGNSMGYFAGVTCAMLVARICQLYPNAAASTIVSRFFRIYEKWEWPQPVLLKPIEDVPYLHMKVWNPRMYPPDRLHRMPVITPAFPSMCSTHNILQSTQMIIQQEFARGRQVMERIEAKSGNWEELFEKSQFFSINKHFIQLIVTSKSKEQHKIWSGYVESKVRHLCAKLEFVENIAAVPPFPEMFERVQQAGGPVEDILRYHSRQKEQAEGADTPEEQTSSSTETPTCSAAFYIAICIAPRTTTGPIRLDIHRPVAEFKEFVTKWDKHEEGMELLIKDLKRDDLPDYLFETGQRPTKGKRVKSTAKEEKSPTTPSNRQPNTDEKTTEEPKEQLPLPISTNEQLNEVHSTGQVHDILHSPSLEEPTKRSKEQPSVLG